MASIIMDIMSESSLSPGGLPELKVVSGDRVSPGGGSVSWGGSGPGSSFAVVSDGIDRPARAITLSKKTKTNLLMTVTSILGIRPPV